MSKKLCVVFKEGRTNTSSDVIKTKELIARYGWKLLHEVTQVNDSYPLMLHFLPTKTASVDALSGALYKMDHVKNHSFPPTRSIDV
jgi:hypothetical protein